MAKGKKNPQAKEGPVAPGQTQGQGQGQLQRAIVSPGMFPIKPKRIQLAPGRSVELRTNLFKMSLDQKKSIYKITVDVELEALPKSGDTKEDEKPKTEADKPIKIGNEFRRMAVDGAIKIWINNNPAVNLPFCLDSNGSIIYALFNPFPKGEASHEFRVPVKLKQIEDQKLIDKEKIFRVKFHNCSPVDVPRLFDFCTGKITADYQTVQEEIRALNVLVRGELARKPDMFLTRFNVFPFNAHNQFKASPGVLVNRGFTTSVRAAECGVILNVANTICSFHEEMSLIDLLKAKFHHVDLSKPLRNDIIEWLKKELFNKQIEARHINYGQSNKNPHYRKYRVGDIGGSAMDKFFLLDKATRTSQEITIFKYFKIRHNVTLKYPNLPCVVDKGNKIPLETCHLIEKQRVIRKMDPDETARIIRETALPPQQHFKLVDDNAKVVQAHSKQLKEFGVSFSITPIDVLGRELVPVSLLANKNARGGPIKPENGEYRAERFFKPAMVKNWSLLFLMDHEVQADKQRNGPNELFPQRFSQLYCEAGMLKGVQLNPLAKEFYNCIIIDDENVLRQTLGKYVRFLNQKKIDHCIVVLPRRCPEWTYRYLQYLEVSAAGPRGVNENFTRLSCLKYENYMKKIIDGRDNGRMFLQNLWLKYNTKLGGINFVLNGTDDKPFLRDGVIFISVDVCHPAPGDKLIQSVAAVVGMWDLTNENMSYCTRLRVQKKMSENKSTIEEVGDIGLMFEEVLESYRLKKNKYPTKIVVLRDGVSEGQLRIVLEKELGKVKQSLANKYNNVKQPVPPLACLVVQKRHKVRFMRKTPLQGRKGPDYNIQPGTVVDSTITHPTDFSFYLAPHKAIQGTSRAAHVYIICDEIGFSQDMAQSMVHALSYLSPRCTKSTSIPTPVNLADLAAERGRNLVISWNDDHHKMSEADRLEKLNSFLSTMGDQRYKNTLYYI